jgi:hypothetical protein
LNEKCSSCGSDLVSELASGPRQFPKGGRDDGSRGLPLGARRIDAIKCLACGTDRVLNS